MLNLPLAVALPLRPPAPPRAIVKYDASAPRAPAHGMLVPRQLDLIPLQDQARQLGALPSVRTVSVKLATLSKSLCGLALPKLPSILPAQHKLVHSLKPIIEDTWATTIPHGKWLPPTALIATELGAFVAALDKLPTDADGAPLDPLLNATWSRAWLGTNVRATQSTDATGKSAEQGTLVKEAYKTKCERLAKTPLPGSSVLGGGGLACREEVARVVQLTEIVEALSVATNHWSRKSYVRNRRAHGGCTAKGRKDLGRSNMKTMGMHKKAGTLTAALGPALSKVTKQRPPPPPRPASVLSPQASLRVERAREQQAELHLEAGEALLMLLYSSDAPAADGAPPPPLLALEYTPPYPSTSTPARVVAAHSPPPSRSTPTPGATRARRISLVTPTKGMARKKASAAELGWGRK